MHLAAGCSGHLGRPAWPFPAALPRTAAAPRPRPAGFESPRAAPRPLPAPGSRLPARAAPAPRRRRAIWRLRSDPGAPFPVPRSRPAGPEGRPARRRLQADGSTGVQGKAFAETLASELPARLVLHSEGWGGVVSFGVSLTRPWTELRGCWRPQGGHCPVGQQGFVAKGAAVSTG